jgi:glyoxylase-like metal-dependent hydrolase (beta-lactamase superfamily II)
MCHAVASTATPPRRPQPDETDAENHARRSRRGDRMTEIVPLGDGVHCLRGAVNSGLVMGNTGITVIDTGLDRGAANRIARAAESLGARPVAIVNTHAHADHHGGNAHLVRRLDLPVHAPAFDEAVIREPGYEPLYLFGAAPIRALENRFLRAEPSPVDNVFGAGDRLEIDGRTLEVLDLGGHSIGQVGIRVGGVLFCADAFFGLEPLAKHGVPLVVDAERAAASLVRLRGEEAGWFVPGHGEPLREPGETLDANLEVMDRVRTWLCERLLREPVGTEDLLAEWSARFGLRVDDPTAWVLSRSMLLGYLGAMERGGEIGVEFAAGRWLWRGR